MENKQPSGVLCRIKSLYESTQWHDLEFCVRDCNAGGSSVIFRAHRLILAPCSPVFEALCYGPMAEKSSVVITDIDPAAFESMLNFLYTDFIELKTVDLALNLLYAAKKYLVPTLAALAGKYLAENISDKNCVDIYNLSDLVENKELTQVAYDYICRRLSYIYSCVHSDNINHDLLVKLVASKYLNCPEITLVHLAQTWAKGACDTMGLEPTSTNMRNLLVQYNIFQNIRWHLLSDEDLDKVLPDLLSEEEKLARRERVTLERRNLCPAKYAYVHRYSDGKLPWKEEPREDMTILTQVKVNKSINLQGIFLNAKSAPLLLQKQSAMLCYKERMMMTVKKDNDVVLTRDICQDIEYGKPFLISLERGLPFSEDTIYEIYVKLQGSSASYPFEVVLSTVTKVPSGLSVTCTQYADVFHPGNFMKVKDFGIITGFQFIC